MVQILVGNDDRLTVKFGSDFNAHCFPISREELIRMTGAEEREAKVRMALEEMRAGRTRDRDAITKMAIDLSETREMLRVARLECVPNHCIHSADIERVRADSQAMQARLASAISDRDSYRDDNEKLERELCDSKEGETKVRLAHMHAQEEIKRLKCGPSCCATINRLNEELEEAKRVIQQSRQNRIEPGQPVYMLDKTMADDIKALLKNCKPGPITLKPRESAWRPIETAPIGQKILLVAGKGWGPVQAWHDLGAGRWFSGSSPINQPTHWMPLPEPPK